MALIGPLMGALLAAQPQAHVATGTAAEAPRDIAQCRSQPPRSRYRLTIPLDPPNPGPPIPTIQGPSGRPLVVIDAGHGGHDPGAIGTRAIREKDITLGLARAIRDELLAGGRVRVAMTRADDRFLVLRERFAIARNIKADLFISVHADSAPTADVRGTTVYTLSEVASDAEAQMLANRENKVDIINGVNLGGDATGSAPILVDLAQRETMAASSAFAALLRREGGGLIPFRPDYHRMAGFAVLKAPDMPSVLIEAGYMSSESDVARLRSADGRTRMAQGIRRAIEVFLAQRTAPPRP